MSLNTPSNAPHLADLASELDRFSTLLEQEAAALGSGKADALAPLIAQREVMNRRLASLWQALLDSVGLPAGAALATVVGVLVEVPVMLSVCSFCNRTRHWFPRESAADIQTGRS